jgi:outer membrane lipoprotein-sorting protein
MKKIWIVCLFFICSIRLLFPVSIEDIMAKYKENMKKLKSLQAIMVMNVKTGENYNQMKMKYINKERKVYIKSKPPFSFLLISNGEKAHFYSPKDNTVWLYYPGQYAQALEDPLQKKKDVLQDILELEKVGEDYMGWKKISVYEGQPAASDKFVSKMRLWVDTDSGFLYRVESYDLHDDLISRMVFKKYRNLNGVWLNLVTQSWNKTEKDVIESTSEFRDVVVNAPVDDKIFEFQYPKGVKIKDLTEMIMKGETKK